MLFAVVQNNFNWPSPIPPKYNFFVSLSLSLFKKSEFLTNANGRNVNVFTFGNMLNV